MAAQDTHRVFSDNVLLRDAVNSYGPPSEQLINYAKWIVPGGRTTVEIGLSVLTVYLAARSTAHSCIVPSEAAAEALRGALADLRIETGTLRILVGDTATATAGLETGSIDTVVLSCPPAFPAYYAACHESLRLLRVGGRLLVRGVGVWTVEQFRNHLRLDPRFNGYAAAAPDASVIVKAAETQHVEWFQQPYVVVNSTVFDAGAALHVRSQSSATGIRIFSSTVERIEEVKAVRALTVRTPDVGLAGYYGFGNYGDELFRTCFEVGLPDVRLRMLHDQPRRPFAIGDKRARVLRVDAVLIGGGDLVIPNYWNGLYFEEDYLERPVFVHGVGVPRGSGGDAKVIARLRAFMRHPNVRHINVRDAESRDWIEKHLQPLVEVDLSPDIVCGLDIPDRRPLPDRTLALVTRKMKVPPESYGPLRALALDARARGLRVRIVMAGAGLIAEDDYADVITRGLGFDEIVHCETMEEVTAAIIDCETVVSMKFHGCVVGIMAGLPTFSLLTSDKFVNFYRALGLEHMIMPHSDPRVAGVLDLPQTTVDPSRLKALRAGARSAMGRLRAKMDAELGLRAPD